MGGNVFLGSLPIGVLKELKDLSRPNTFRGLYLYAKVYAAIIATFIANYYLQSVAVLVISVIFIAGRQHSLYILNHDASHLGLFKTKWANKWVASLLSNFVMFHHPSAWSFEQWQRVHYFHHRELFTSRDPNYVDRVNAGDTHRQLSIGQLFISCVKAGLMSPIKIFSGYHDYVPPTKQALHQQKNGHLRSLLLPFKNDYDMELERYAKLAFIASTFFLVVLNDLLALFFLLWVLPMYTIFPMILTFMDLTEHRWNSQSTDVIQNSRSVQYGVLEKLVLSFLPRGFHREHHLCPRVIAADLPKLSKLLCENGNLGKPLRGVIGLLSDITRLRTT